MQPDLLMPRPVFVMHMNAELFTDEFTAYLPDNLHVFEAEALKVIARGWKHYSARTILHVLRHHSALAEHSGEGWKLNNNHSPYFARLFDLLYPQHVGLWEMRETKTVKQLPQGAPA